MSENTITRIHHMGFVVKDLEETVRVWERLFGVKAQIKENPDLQVRLASMEIAGIKFVFNTSTAPGSRWEQFINEHGEGLEHVAFEVTDIEDGCRTARELGLRVRFAEHKPMYDTISNFIEQAGVHATTLEFMQPVR